MDMEKVDHHNEAAEAGPLPENPASTKPTITIDSEIQSLIPALKPNELQKLRESILAEGCRDPLVVWKKDAVLLDGHNRYKICKDAGLGYKTIEMDFPDKDHAMIWVIRNQLGRRNLSDIQFKLMVGKQYELEKKVSWGGDRKSDAINENQLPQSEGDDSLRETAERLAKEHNISRSTVERSADLYKSYKVIHEVDPEISKRLESGEIKASKKDILVLGKVLNQGTVEQKEQIVSDLKNDPRKAIDKAKKIEGQSKQENHSSEPETPHDDHIGDVVANSEVIPTELNSDLDAFLVLASRICCPKCGKNALTTLKWSCCGLSIDKAANLTEDIEPKPTGPADTPGDQVEKREQEHAECVETAAEDCAQGAHHNYSEMASWIPPDNSSLETSKIIRASSCLLQKGEAPRVDSLAEMTGLSAEVVRANLENASWVEKDDSSPDGIPAYLPKSPRIS
jgi:hypothetical protein